MRIRRTVTLDELNHQSFILEALEKRQGHFSIYELLGTRVLL